MYLRSGKCRIFRYLSVEWLTARWNLLAVIHYVCFFSTMSIPALLSTKASMQWMMVAQRPTREADYLVFLLVAEVVSDWILLLPPNVKAPIMVNIEHVLD